MIRAYSEWVVRKRWWIILASLPLILAAASGGRFITFSDDYRVFFSKDNPDLLAFEALQNTYSKQDNILFVVAPKDGNVFTRETLATVEWLTKESWQIPHSSRVDSVTNFQHTSAREDDLVVRDLVEEADKLSDNDLARIKVIALAEPALVNRLVSPRGRVAGVNVTVITPNKSTTEVPEAANYARELAKQAKARNPNLDVYLTGIVMVNNAFNEEAMRDMKTLVPIMYGVILLVTFLLLRSATSTVTILFAIGISILTAMGMAGWLGVKLSPTSAGAPTIIMTVAVADCIHLLLSMFHFMRQGMEKNRAIVESLTVNFRALFLTAIDTIIGFLTLNTSSVPPYRDLGNMVAMGVAVAFLFTMLLLPALLAAIPLRAKSVSWTVEELPIGRFADWIIRNRKRVLWGTCLASLVLIACIPLNEFNDLFAHYFDHSTEIRKHNDFADANLAGAYLIDYSIRSGQSGGVTDPAYLKKLEEFAQWYKSQPGVRHVNVFTDVMKRLNKNMNGDDPAFYRIPDDRKLAAQYLLLYELSLPFGLNLNDQISVDRSATRVTVTTKSLSSREMLALDAEAQKWLRENAPEPMVSGGTGTPIMFGHIGILNTQSVIQGDILGVIFIAIVMVIALKSFRFGLATMIPNLLPIGMAYGFWGILVGRVGMDAAPVSGMTLGMLVDDTTHNMTKYLYARREKGFSPEDAVRYSFSTVGIATMATSLVLMAGFGVLAFSSFTFNSTMGLLSAVTIGIGGLAEFFLMPPLMLRMEKRRQAKAGPTRLTEATSDAIAGGN
jgi:uncharacterized protein